MRDGVPNPRERLRKPGPWKPNCPARRRYRSRGPHLRSRRQKFPSLSTLLHPEVPPLPPETKLEASEEDSPDFPDEATIPNREGSVESPEEDAVDPPLPSEGAGARLLQSPVPRRKRKNPEPSRNSRWRIPNLRCGTNPFHSVRGSGLPEKGEPAGEIPEPPIAETIASPKDEESSNEAHEKPVSMPEEKPSLENQEEIPVSLPSPRMYPRMLLNPRMNGNPNRIPMRKETPGNPSP